MNAIEEYDKFTAAVHEAGHLTIAYAQRRYGSAEIWPRENPAPHELTWCGNFSMISLVELGGGPMTPEIAVAGEVAEVWFHDRDIEAPLVCDYITNEEHSTTDLVAWPNNDLECTVARVLDLLRLHADTFQWAVQVLMDQQCISDGMTKVRAYHAGGGGSGSVVKTACYEHA